MTTSDLRLRYHVRGRRPSRLLAWACVILLWSSPASALAPNDPSAASYRQARRLIETKAERALAIARSIEPFERADELRHELVGQAALAAADAPLAARELEAFAEESDAKRAAFTARLDAAEMRILAGDRDGATSALARLDRDRKKLDGRYSTRRHLSARVIRLRHDLARSAGETRRARRLAIELLVAYPSEAATRRPGLAASPEDLSRSQRFARAKALYRAWSYAEARALFEEFEGDKKRGEVARWHLAQIALNKLRDDPERAERLFGALAKSKRYGEEALYQRARAQMRQEDYDAALKTLARYERTYPRGARVPDVYYYRGWLPYDHRENERALEGFETYIKKYGRGRKSSYVHGFRAWALMRLERWEEALGAWSDVEAFGNPIVEGKALYWGAWTEKKLGREAAAIEKLDRLRARYPVTYYGVLGEQLRAEIEGSDPRASAVWWPEKSGEYPTEPALDARALGLPKLTEAERARWRLVLDLAALGEHQKARDELAPIYESILRQAPSDERMAWVHALGHLVKDYNAIWKVGARGSIRYLPPVPDPIPLRSSMAYPRAYEEVVDEVAAEFGLPPHLIWAIMRQESRYKPTAISNTDAVGALQMIPPTARKVARDLGEEYNPRTFFYPEVGFRFSGFYMRKLLDTFGGLFVPMAAAYNTGPGPIARWFKKNPDASFPWLIEEFEYNEGRAYCRKVAEHMTRYIYLYVEDEEERGRLLDQLYPLSRDIDLPEDVGY